MSAARIPGAPRLIEWTGERCVPWTADASMAYEHYRRYAWAAQLVGGRRVLDLGSGEGFGAAILAETAAEVLGVDIDDDAVRHSRANYARSNLRFERASAKRCVGDRLGIARGGGRIRDDRAPARPGARGVGDRACSSASRGS